MLFRTDYTKKNTIIKNEKRNGIGVNESMLFSFVKVKFVFLSLSLIFFVNRLVKAVEILFVVFRLVVSNRNNWIILEKFSANLI